MGAACGCYNEDAVSTKKESVNIEPAKRNKSRKPWKKISAFSKKNKKRSSKIEDAKAEPQWVWKRIERPDLHQVDEYAANCPSESANDVENLANYLAKAEFNDFQKSRAIFYWIANNIKYDKELEKRDRRSAELAESTQPMTVLRRRQSVCGGYANLFQTLAEKLGLDSTIVPGVARNKDGLGPHAWNIVKIDDAWQLIDSTWASITREQGDSGYLDYFFCTDPMTLIYTHFPTNPRQQLLDSPVSREEFEAFPTFTPSVFFTHFRLQKSSPHSGTLMTDDHGGVHFELALLNNSEVMAALFNQNEQKEEYCTLVERKEDLVKVYVAAPRTGNFKLRVLVHDAKDEKKEIDSEVQEPGSTLYSGMKTITEKFWEAVEYTVNAENIKGSFYGLPTVTNIFCKYLGFNSPNSRVGILRVPVDGEIRFSLSGALRSSILTVLSQNEKKEEYSSMIEKTEDTYEIIIAVTRPGEFDFQIFAGEIDQVEKPLAISYKVDATKVSDSAPLVGVPIVENAFYNYLGFDSKNSKTGILIPDKDGNVELSLSCRDDASILCSLKAENSVQEETYSHYIEKRRVHYNLFVSIPRREKFIFQVYAGLKEDTQKPLALQYLIDGTRIPQSSQAQITQAQLQQLQQLNPQLTPQISQIPSTQIADTPLLGKPLITEQFWKFLGFTPRTPRIGTLFPENENGEYKLELLRQNDSHLLCYLTEGEGDSERFELRYDMTPHLFLIFVVPPRPGFFTLQIFAGEREATSMPLAIQYRYNATKWAGKPQTT